VLQEGSQGRVEGHDVVIGYLEPHDRPDTAALAEGLEVVPRLAAADCPLELEEMDVDAVIARAPEIALIDELAHTYAPGMRNERRWQDIEDVLDSGSAVISTVNVQQLESLNDAVFELTGVRVRETFPDLVLDLIRPWVEGQVTSTLSSSFARDVQQRLRLLLNVTL
jgi:two-component system sensor histidine kinase KdpD